jgi:tetratricopeptide (TPR) repeat protein
MHRLARLSSRAIHVVSLAEKCHKPVFALARTFSVRNNFVRADPITQMAIEAEHYAPANRLELEQRVVELEKDVENKDLKVAEQAIDELFTAYKALHRYNKAHELLKRHAIGLKKDIHGTISKEVAQIYSQVADLTSALGLWREAMINQQACIEIKAQLYGYGSSESNQNNLMTRSDRFDLAREWDIMGTINNRLGSSKQAKEFHDRAIKLFEAGDQTEMPIDYVRAISHSAAILYAQKQFEDAYNLYDTAKVASTNLLSSTSQQELADTMSEVFLNMANCAMYTSRTQEAEGMYKRAIQVLSRAFGPSHDRVGSLYYSLGVLYASRGDFERAESFTNDALAILENEDSTMAQRDHYRRKLEIGKCFLTLGTLCLQTDATRAEGYFLKSLEVHTGVASGGAVNADISETHSKLGEKNSLDVAYMMNQLGLLAANREDYELALNYFRKALVITQSFKDNDQSFGSKHVAASALMNIGAHYLRNGMHEDAENHFKQSYNTYMEASLAEYHPDVAELCYLQAKNFFAMKKYKEAKRKCEDSRDITLGAHETPFHPLLDPTLELLRDIRKIMLDKERERAEYERRSGRVPAIEDERKRKTETNFEANRDMESDIREKMIMLRRKKLMESSSSQ